MLRKSLALPAVLLGWMLLAAAPANADRYYMTGAGPSGFTNCSTYVDGSPPSRISGNVRFFLATGTECSRSLMRGETDVSLFDPQNRYVATLDEDSCIAPFCSRLSAANEITVAYQPGLWRQKVTIDLTLIDPEIDPWVVFPPGCIISSGGGRLTCELIRTMII